MLLVIMNNRFRNESSPSTSNLIPLILTYRTRIHTPCINYRNHLRWCLTTGLCCHCLWLYYSFFFVFFLIYHQTSPKYPSLLPLSVSLQIPLKVPGVMQPPRQFRPPLLSSPSPPSPSLPLLLLRFYPHHAPRVTRHRRASVRQILSLDSKVFASLFCFLEE
jgi:hypothetical protein